MLKKERFTAKQSTAMGQIPRSIERCCWKWQHSLYRIWLQYFIFT